MPFGSNIVSPSHLLLVVLVVLVVFGPKRLPELGRGIGGALREFRGGVKSGPEEPAAVERPAAAAEVAAEPAEPAASPSASSPR